MAYESIQRTLWHDGKEGRTELAQTELHGRSEPLVILGEAGMGKSHLLEWLSTFPEYRKCTARQLLYRADPKTLLGDARVLVIDAVDELSSQKEGDAVGLVLRQLGMLGYPAFVLSCRVADWRSATGLEAIREQYDREPLELHLNPFDDNDAIAFLGSRLGSVLAKDVVEHFNNRGLNGLLGNPQTLDLITRVAKKGRLPETRGELFDSAIDVLRTEHQDRKADNQPACDIGLDAAGAAFAGLILTGSEAIVRTATANAAEGELQLSEVTTLPQGEAIGAMLGTRLFKAEGADRFSYWHRRIGEFLSAQWLAKQANTSRKRHRLLSLFHSHGLVPASLRGVHAWLARDPALAERVIAADPMGVIEYGDADSLTAEQARLLLKTLALLAEDNPDFLERGHYSVLGIVQPALIDDIRLLITDTGTSFGLKLLILQALRGSKIAPSLAGELKTLITDPSAIFAHRKVAGKVLSTLENDAEWVSIIRTIYKHGDPLSIRLAIELIDEVGYAPFDDELITNLVLAHVSADDRTVGVLMCLEREFPDTRIDSLLDHLTAATKAVGKPYERIGNDCLTDFTRHLVTRCIAAGTTAKKLSLWLEPFDIRAGYQSEVRKLLNTLILKDDSLRRQVQRLVLLEQQDSHTIWQRNYLLCKRSSSFSLSSEDVVSLLETLDPNDRSDERWRDIVQLIQHNGAVGEKARAAAVRFAAHRPDLLAWIDKLAVPQTPPWEVERLERERRYRAKQAIKHAEHRKGFIAHIDAMRAGDYGVLVSPAKAYLKLFSDIDGSEPAHRRIAAWLGEDISEAAHAGFMAYLALAFTKPTAHEISQSIAQDRYWDASYIIIAALAEHRRESGGFDELPSERLMAGLFSLRSRNIDTHAGDEDLEKAVEVELKARGLWADSMRIFYEPQLEAQSKYLHGLDSLMRDESEASTACELACEWLMRFPSLQCGPESELIKRLVRSRKIEDLRRVAATRVALTDVERQRNWDAVNLFTDFDSTVGRLEAQPVEPALLWHLQLGTSRRYDNNAHDMLSPTQLEWIISTFRSLWPMVHRPNTVTCGNTNPWDASDHLIRFIRRLGNDSSEEARTALKRLREAVSDGYTETIKAVAAEQARLRTESAYIPPTLSAINAITREALPLNAADLQVLIIEELKIVQAKIKSDDAESWRGFYDDNGVPFAEERCRDYLLGLLRQGSAGIIFDPEGHVAADKEVDIACSVGALRLPIEIKGQWHKDLWTGADAQLDRLYTPDWRADGRGIYLVLWFGDSTIEKKQLTSPGRGVVRPKVPDELRDMLYAGSNAARDGRVIIFVLNMALSSLRR